MKHLSQMLLTVVSTGVAIATTACSMTPANAEPGNGVSAVIVAPNEGSRASLHNVVRKALQRESVLLADDALIADSTLVIEPMRIRDPSGRLVTDNSVRVERFQLIKRGAECLLVHERSGQHYTLAETTCVAKE